MGLCENVICTDSGQTSRMFESAEQTGIAVSGHGSGYPDEENKEPGTGDDSRKKDCRLFSGNLQQTADRGSDLSVIGTVEKTTGRSLEDGISGKRDGVGRILGMDSQSGRRKSIGGNI